MYHSFFSPILTSLPLFWSTLQSDSGERKGGGSAGIGLGDWNGGVKEEEDKGGKTH